MVEVYKEFWTQLVTDLNVMSKNNFTEILLDTAIPLKMTLHPHLLSQSNRQSK